MRKIIGVIILFSLCTTVLANDVTVIKFEKEIHDFGDIREEGGPVGIKFTFKNIGKNTFQMSEVVATCGCTTSDYTKEEVKKGKTGFVTVIIDPTKLAGTFSKMVVVKGNIHKDIRLYVRGTVIPKRKSKLDAYQVALGGLRFKRKQILVGDVYVNKLDTVKYTIYNQTHTPIRILKLNAPEHIIPKHLPLTIYPKTFSEIEFLYSAHLRGGIGYVFDNITFVTDDKNLPNKTILLVANIKEDFESMTEEELEQTARIDLSFTEHDFGTVVQGKVLTKEIVMKNNGFKPLVINDLDTDCGCTATNLGKRKLEPGELVKFKIVFHTKGRSGPQDRLITIKSNDPTNPEVVITLKANLVEEK